MSNEPENLAADISCSFCGKLQTEVMKIVAGPAVYICDECIGSCNDILAAEPDSPAGREPIPEVAELAELLDGTVVAQAPAKGVLISALRRQCQLRSGAAALSPAPRILLVGPAGSGKTTLGRALCEGPIAAGYRADLTALSESGYQGADVEEVVHGLLAAAGHDVEVAQGGVLFLDRLEELQAVPATGRGREVFGEHLQRELLRLLDGLVLSVPASRGARHPALDRRAIATAPILVVAAVRTARPGSAARPGTPEHRLREELVDMGFLPAFVARFDRIVELHRLGADDMLAILTLAGGLLEQAEELARRLGPRLEISPSAASCLARAAAESRYGAWSLHHGLHRILQEALAEPAPSGIWRCDRGQVEALLER